MSPIHPPDGNNIRALTTVITIFDPSPTKPIPPQWPEVDFPSPEDLESMIPSQWLAQARKEASVPVGAIIGAVLGGLGVLLIAIALVIYRGQRKKRRTRVDPFDAGQAPSVGTPVSTDVLTPVTPSTPSSSPRVIIKGRIPTPITLAPNTPPSTISTSLADPSQNSRSQPIPRSLTREPQHMQHLPCPLSPEATQAMRTLLAFFSQHFRDTREGGRRNIRGPGEEGEAPPRLPPPPYQDMPG